MPHKKLVITVLGCQGFIGKHFTEFCLEQGCIVIGVDKIDYTSSKIFPINKHFHFIQKDINNLERIPDCDVVINFAAQTHVDNSIISSDEFIKSNVCGVKHILQLIKEKQQKPLFIQLSTDEVYGDDDLIIGFKEGDRLNPSSPYSGSKAAADMFIMGFCKTFSLPYVIIRPTNNYGIGQYPEKLISKNLRELARGNKMIMYGTGEYKRYWLHVSDTVNALWILINNQKLLSNRGLPIFNISSDIILSNKDVLYFLLSTFLNKKITDKNFLENTIVIPNRLAEDKIYRINDYQFRETFNWKPKVNNFPEALKKIVEHHQQSIHNWI